MCIYIHTNIQIYLYIPSTLPFSGARPSRVQARLRAQRGGGARGLHNLDLYLSLSTRLSVMDLRVNLYSLFRCSTVSRASSTTGRAWRRRARPACARRWRRCCWRCSRGRSATPRQGCCRCASAFMSDTYMGFCFSVLLVITVETVI